jgi:hypothetical protein
MTSKTASIEPSYQDAKKLTAFLPQLHREGVDPITRWHMVDGEFPHPDYEQWVEDFFEVASQDCWMDFDYDPFETGEVMDDDEHIRPASIEQIKTMLTYCVRGERFCDGFWAGLIREGKILTLVLRVQEIYGISESD